MLAFEQALRTTDFHELAQLAHWLKGAAGTVGYDEFTDPAARLEQAAQHKAISELQSVMAELRALADRLHAPEDETGNAVRS
jgi:HPt (histidine-containing phosphotransfer) domain-containing protein